MGLRHVARQVGDAGEKEVSVVPPAHEEVEGLGVVVGELYGLGRFVHQLGKDWAQALEVDLEAATLRADNDGDDFSSSITGGGKVPSR